jgi:hypothetical protein
MDDQLTRREFRKVQSIRDVETFLLSQSVGFLGPF